MAQEEGSQAKAKSTKVCLTMTRWMALGSSNLQTDQCMKETGEAGKRMEKESSTGKTVKFMKENSKTMSAMGQEYSTIPVGRDLKALGRMERRVDAAPTAGPTAPSTSSSTLTERSKAKASSKELG